MKLKLPEIKAPKRPALRPFLNFIAILAVLGLILWWFESMVLKNQDITELIKALGPFGPLLIITLIILEVIVAPIPGFVLATASGYAFGAFWGSVYTYIGNTIGSIIAFFLARKYGRPLVERLVNKKKLDIYDGFFQDWGNKLLWVVYLFPIFPADIVSFAAGMTNVKKRDFIFIVSVAFIPSIVIFNNFGAALYESALSSHLLLIGAIILFIMLVGGMIMLYMKRHHFKY